MGNHSIAEGGERRRKLNCNFESLGGLLEKLALSHRANESTSKF